MLGLITTLITGVPKNTLSDPAPFSVAKSFEQDGIVAYTITGPKVEKTRSLALAILGFPWLLAAVILPFSPNPNTTAHPAIVYPILLGVGALMCYQAWFRRRAATTRYQIEIDRDSGEVVLSKDKPAMFAHYDHASIIRRTNFDKRHHLVTIAYGRFVMVLGAFKKPENAQIYADLLAQETNLPQEDAPAGERVHMHYANRIVGSDNRALEKPVPTPHLPIRFK